MQFVPQLEIIILRYYGGVQQDRVVMLWVRGGGVGVWITRRVYWGFAVSSNVAASRITCRVACALLPFRSLTGGWRPCDWLNRYVFRVTYFCNLRHKTWLQNSNCFKTVVFDYKQSDFLTFFTSINFILQCSGNIF